MTAKPSYAELEQRIQLLEEHMTEFKQKEEDFNQNQIEMDLLFSKAPLAMFIVDHEHRVCKLNEAVSEMACIVEKENIGLPTGDVLKCVNIFEHPKGCGYSDACEGCMIRKTILETFQTGKDYNSIEGIIRYSTAEESIVLQILISTTLLSLPDHKKVLVCLNDVTKIKQTEAELRQNEKRYRRIFKNNHAIMLLIDPETADIVDANPAATLFYGWNREEITTKKITDINLLNEDQVLQEMKKASIGHQNRFNFQHQLANGSIHDVEICSGLIEINSKQLLLSIVFDITDRKLVEKKLKESEQTARAILNASTESAFLIKKDGTFLDMNQITAERLGKDVEVLIGKNSFDMIPAKIAKSQRPILERIINEKQPILVRDERPGFILETNLNPVIDYPFQYWSL